MNAVVLKNLYKKSCCVIGPWRKLWYVVLAALPACISGIVALGFLFLIQMSYNHQFVVDETPDNFFRNGYMFVGFFGMFILPIVLGSAVLAAYPVYLLTNPPKKYGYSAALGLVSGFLIIIGVGMCLSLESDALFDSAFYYFYSFEEHLKRYLCFVLLAGGIGAVFMVVLNWLTLQVVSKKSEVVETDYNESRSLEGHV